MMKPTTELEAALGLGSAVLQRVETVHPPASSEGHGLSAGAPLGAVVEDLLAAPYAAEPLALGVHGLEHRPGELRRWTRDPGIFLLDTSGRLRRVQGAHRELGPDELIVDGREKTAWVRLMGGGQDLVWSLDRSGATLYRVDAPRPPELERLAQAQPSPLPVLEVPELRSMTGGARLESWLEERFRALAGSPSLLDRAASAGMIGRLWSPVGPRPGLEALLSMRLPSDLTREWMAGQPQATREAVESLAIAEAGHLGAELASLEREVLEASPDARRAARAWVAGRDALESVHFVLGGEARVPALTAALARLDANVADFHGIWSLLEAWEDDPILLAISWREPDAWWGRLTGG